jgi:hypothetical protein
MLTKVEVRTDQGALLTLDLFDPEDGFQIQNILGLEPVDATLVYSSMVGQDDEQEQSSKRVKRNIIFEIGYEPDWANETIWSLRNTLYGFFMPKNQVRLRFYSDTMPTVEIVGRVEKFSSPLFGSADPKATISIICAKSNFVGLDVLSFGGNTTSGSTEIERVYSGSIETGFLFTLSPNRAISEFTINNRLPNDAVVSQEFQYPLLDGDVLTINSVALNKYVRLTRAGSTGSALFGVSPYSQWVNLFPGVNNLRVVAAGDPIPWTIQYANKYGGL